MTRVIDDRPPRWCQARYCSRQVPAGHFCAQHARRLDPELAARVAAITARPGVILGAPPSPEGLATLETLAQAVELCAIDERYSVVNVYRLRAGQVRTLLERAGRRGPHEAAEMDLETGAQDQVQAKPCRCPNCGQPCEWIRCCPTCGRRGCERCLPGGADMPCPDCRRDIT